MVTTPGGGGSGGDSGGENGVTQPSDGGGRGTTGEGGDGGTTGEGGQSATTGGEKGTTAAISTRAARQTTPAVPLPPIEITYCEAELVDGRKWPRTSMRTNLEMFDCPSGLKGMQPATYPRLWHT